MIDISDMDWSALIIYIQYSQNYQYDYFHDRNQNQNIQLLLEQ